MFVNPLIILKHPQDFYKGLNRMYNGETLPTDSSVLPTSYWDGSHQLIDLGFDNWGIACNVTYKVSTHLSFTCHYSTVWLKVLFIQVDNSDTFVEVEFIVNEHKKQGGNALFEYNINDVQSWIQHSGDVKMVLLFLNESFFISQGFSQIRLDYANKALRFMDNVAQLQYLAQKHNLPFDNISEASEVENKEKLGAFIDDFMLYFFPSNVLLSSQKKHKEYQQVIEASKLLVANFKMPPPRLDDLAKIAGMNRVKFQQEFKTYFGQNFYQYFQQERFKYAKQLLESKQCNITEAAYAVGFTNITHFSRQFQKYMNLKPNDLKNKISDVI
ncbi:MAG: helix-turn-helix domain-containing protein [Spirosomataceae bacterium]